MADVSLLSKLCDVAPESSTCGMLVVSVSSIKMGEVKSLVRNSEDVVYLSEPLMDIPLEEIASVLNISVVGLDITSEKTVMVSVVKLVCWELPVSSVWLRVDVGSDSMVEVSEEKGIDAETRMALLVEDIPRGDGVSDGSE